MLSTSSWTQNIGMSKFMGYSIKCVIKNLISKI